jgi:CheY-like chemotaxis protein
VLVIDAEPMIGRLIANLLPQRHDVVSLTSARAAFDRFDQGEQFDVIVCDLLMPDVGGPEVYDAIASRWPSFLPRLVIMTGGASSPNATAFLEQARCPSFTSPSRLRSSSSSSRLGFQRRDPSNAPRPARTS